MAELPSGTVTFLFTDIEGSTALLNHSPETIGIVPARHDALIRATVDAKGGAVPDRTCAATVTSNLHGPVDHRVGSASGGYGPATSSRLHLLSVPVSRPARSATRRI